MEVFIRMLVSWAPMILLIVVWIAMVRIFGKKQKSYMEHLQGIEKSMERIAIALEKYIDKNENN